MRSGFLMLALLAGAAASPPSIAEDMAPGLWEIAMEMRVAATPGVAPGPFRVTQCITAADARDPSRLLGGLSNPGASSCAYSDKSYSGNTFRFTMQCSGAYAMQSRGEILFSSNAMEGAITAAAIVNGERINTRNRVAARRLGGC